VKRFTTPPSDLPALYYRKQRPAAKRYNQGVLAQSVPGCSAIENLPSTAAAPTCSERKISYVDLSLFQIVDGLRYAFPKRMKRFEKKCRVLSALGATASPSAADRRLSAIGAANPFNEWGRLPRLPRARRLNHSSFTCC